MKSCMRESEANDMNNKSITWKELLTMEDLKLHNEADEFSPKIKVDYQEINLTRCRLELYYKDVDSFVYKDVLKNNMGIFVKAPGYKGAIPPVYIQMNSERRLLGEQEESFRELLCSKIIVEDETLYKDKKKLLALLLFYLTYPIRAKRLVKESMSG